MQKGSEEIFALVSDGSYFLSFQEFSEGWLTFNKGKLTPCSWWIYWRTPETDKQNQLPFSLVLRNTTLAEINIFLQCIAHCHFRVVSGIHVKTETAKWPYLSTVLFIQFFVSANPSTTCCDSISRSVSDGTGGSQTAAAAAAAASFCCPSYENRLLASSRTELNAALGMYSSPYAAAAAASQNYANYFPYSTDPSAIYSTLVGFSDAHRRGARVDRSAGFINLSHTANISVSTSRLIQLSFLSP